MVRSILVVSMALWLSACSWASMSKPEPNYRAEIHGYPSCTSRGIWPWADTAAATYTYLATSAIIAATYESDEVSTAGTVALGLIVGTPAVLYTRSAVTGFHRARTCRLQRSSYALHNMRQRESRTIDERDETRAIDERDETRAIDERDETRAIDEQRPPRPLPGDAHRDREPPVGAEGGSCTRGGACDPGLVCEEATNTCELDEPPIGAENGPCTAGGACDLGLVCAAEEHICRPADAAP